MAERSLRLIFENALDATREVTITIPRADDTKTGAVIRLAMQAIADNYDCFILDIGAIKAAKFVTPASYTPVNLG